MSDLLKSLESRVSEADWQLMANHANMSVEELKPMVLEALLKVADQALAEEKSDAVAVSPIPVISELKKVDDCLSQDFSVSLFDIVGVKGTITLCGQSSSDWTAELKVCLTVAGASVWCASYKFDPHNLSVCLNPSVGIAKAELCFKLDIENNKICLGLSGEACAWAITWRCASFDINLFCIPLP